MMSGIESTPNTVEPIVKESMSEFLSSEVDDSK